MASTPQPAEQSFAVAHPRFAGADFLGRVVPLPQPAGLVLVTSRLEPIFSNRSAIQILGYPDGAPADRAAVQQRLRTLLGTDMLATTQQIRIVFLSGRRTYICQSLVMEPLPGGDGSSVTALLLERRPRDPVAISELSRRFRLSSRESETVRHLIDGRSTKEVAARMGVSPHTVKQFVRLAMSKMGVSSRSAIVGKVLSN